MYPAEIVKPMRDELTAVGFDQCTTPESVASVSYTHLTLPTK